MKKIKITVIAFLISLSLVTYSFACNRKTGIEMDWSSSSFIDYAEYDYSLEIITLSMKGREYDFDVYDCETWHSYQRAYSKGSFYHNRLK